MVPLSEYFRYFYPPCCAAGRTPSTTTFFTSHFHNHIFSADMEVDNFQATTEAFLAWLGGIGVRINSKMEVRDLRNEGRGRGVGEFFGFSLLGALQGRYLPVRRIACGFWGCWLLVALRLFVILGGTVLILT